MIAELAEPLERAGFTEPEIVRRARLVTRAASGLGAGPSSEAIVLHAPGRIEFLGKHTDYAGGRSLVCATEQGLAFVARPRDDDRLALLDAVTGERREMAIDPAAVPLPGDWANYAVTVVRRLARDFPGRWRGLDVAFASDLPRAAGVSSSSALIVGLALAVLDRNEVRERARFRTALPDLIHLAGYLGALENGRPFAAFEEHDGVGTMGGSQDQTAILCAEPDALARYGFDPVRFEGRVPVPRDLVFVVGASGVLAEKTGDALTHYNAIATATAEIWSIGRDAAGGAPTLGAALDDGPETASGIRERIRAQVHDPDRRDRLLRRLDQLDQESRVLIPAAAAALAAGDLDGLGRAVAASQAGAERGLGNQIPETVGLVRRARELGAIAASAFGAGFGGAVWALVRTAELARFLPAWRDAYAADFPRRAAGASFVSTRAAPAARRLR